LPQVSGPSTVVGDGTTASCTEAALKSAVSGGGTITFDCGPGKVTIPINATITVTKPTLVDGGGKVTLDGQDKTQIFVNKSTLVVKGLTFTRGWLALKWSGAPGGGGAISSNWSKELQVFDCTFKNNKVGFDGFGGAIFQASNGKLVVVGSHFEGNESGGGGAVYCLLAAMEICDSTFKQNRGKNGSTGGGAIHTDGFSGGSGNKSSGGVGRICGSSFEDNEAFATGGGVYFYAYPKDKVYVDKSTFKGNKVNANKGGVSMGGALRLGRSPAQVTDTIFRNNSASMGGAIATEGKEPATIKGCTFGGNSSNIQGGKTTEVGNTYE
jgi:predicted outer membrane repeat protein